MASAGSEVKTLHGEITDVTHKLFELKSFAPAYIGKKQLQSVDSLLAQDTGNLQKEKEHLKEVEVKLEAAQKLVEAKESQQQETKTTKDTDEQKLHELLSHYTQISDDAMMLERSLAQSLKNLESIIAEVTMTEDQKAVLNLLLETLTEGGGRLRELIPEYQTVKERLEMLEQQHNDLDEEYTKLVEQQLGE